MKDPIEPADAPGTNEPGAGAVPPAALPTEVGGRPGPEPTRYGDWEKNGCCIDF